MSVNRMIAIAASALMAVLMWAAYASAHSYSNDASLLVQQAAIRHHVPVDFAMRVARQETGGKGGRCGLRGAAGEVGPLQILPATARGMGYRNVASATCEAQVDAGMAHLAKCWRHFPKAVDSPARCCDEACEQQRAAVQALTVRQWQTMKARTA